MDSNCKVMGYFVDIYAEMKRGGDGICCKQDVVKTIWKYDINMIF